MPDTRTASAALIASTLFFSSFLQAMTFQQFDHMAAQDRQDYLDFLVDASQRVLIDQGRKDVAAKVYQLFHEIHPGDHLSIGEAEFEGNLAHIRTLDAERHAQNHDAPRAQVEAALALTLNNKGIQVTPDFVKSFVQLANTFKPKHGQDHKK